MGKCGVADFERMTYKQYTALLDVARAADRYWIMESNCDRSECATCPTDCELKYIGAALSRCREAGIRLEEEK